MISKCNPYLNFKGDTREAMEFYHGVFGGDLTINTYALGGMPHDPAEGDKILHAQLDGHDGLTLMASDTPNGMPFTPGSQISISLSGDNDAQLRDWFAKLAGSGAVTMPLEQAPWGDLFGACTDKYGINWMVNISPAKTDA